MTLRLVTIGLYTIVHADVIGVAGISDDSSLYVLYCIQYRSDTRYKPRQTVFTFALGANMATYGQRMDKHNRRVPNLIL